MSKHQMKINDFASETSLYIHIEKNREKKSEKTHLSTQASMIR